MWSKEPVVTSLRKVKAQNLPRLHHSKALSEHRMHEAIAQKANSENHLDLISPAHTPL